MNTSPFESKCHGAPANRGLSQGHGRRRGSLANVQRNEMGMPESGSWAAVSGSRAAVSGSRAAVSGLAVQESTWGEPPSTSAWGAIEPALAPAWGHPVSG